LAWTEILLFMLPPIAGMIGTHHHAQIFLLQRESHKFFA
jgi:hypothetical protein